MKNKVKILLENILIEAAVDRPNRPKIKLRAMWQDREERRLERKKEEEERRIEQLQKILSQETFDEDLDLSEEPIKNLGNIRHVKGNLNLYDCKSLTSLPANLTVEGDLNLSYCTNLTSLPADLEVNRDLDLTDCTSLTSLPADLKVGSRLWLTRCRNLTSLPADLKVGGLLNLRSCKRSVIDQAIQMFGKNKVIYK